MDQCRSGLAVQGERENLYEQRPRFAPARSVAVLGKGASSYLGPGYLGRFFDEGLIILGWVAHWRPVEIFLYDWWPIVRRERLYRRLSRAVVKIEVDDPKAGNDMRIET